MSAKKLILQINLPSLNLNEFGIHVRTQTNNKQKIVFDTHLHDDDDVQESEMLYI